MFLVAAVVSTGCLLASAWSSFPWQVRLIALLVGWATIAQTGVSLIVSHWVYDRSGLYDLTWLPQRVPGSPRNIVNVHAGFDESSEALAAVYPSANLRILNFYDERRNTEPSIARARKLKPATRTSESASVNSLPLANESQDLVLLFLAAHEIRNKSDRSEFFQEVRRSLRPGGSVILVEHLRDAANALAYGPGSLHFHSRTTWLHAILSTGLKLVTEFKITPLIQVFVCSRCS
jgi:SAM-dependent methyltransferase